MQRDGVSRTFPGGTAQAFRPTSGRFPSLLRKKIRGNPQYVATATNRKPLPTPPTRARARPRTTSRHHNESINRDSRAPESIFVPSQPSQGLACLAPAHSVRTLVLAWHRPAPQAAPPAEPAARGLADTNTVRLQEQQSVPRLPDQCVARRSGQRTCQHETEQPVATQQHDNRSVSSAVGLAFGSARRFLPHGTTQTRFRQVAETGAQGLDVRAPRRPGRGGGAGAVRVAVAEGLPAPRGVHH